MRSHSELLEELQHAIEYANSFIKFSNTAVKVTAANRKALKAKVRASRERTLSLEESLFELYSFPETPLQKFWKRRVHGAKKNEAGNCQELCDLVINYLRKRNISAESVTIVEGDHGIVVIGREENSNIAKPATWGANAIICDPTLKKSYPSTDYKKYLMCHRSQPDEYYTNVYYPYHKEALKTSFALHMRKNKDYQLSLIYEAKSRIKIIESAASTQLNSDIKALCAQCNKEIDVLYSDLEIELKETSPEDKSLEVAKKEDSATSNKNEASPETELATHFGKKKKKSRVVKQLSLNYYDSEIERQTTKIIKKLLKEILQAYKAQTKAENTDAMVISLIEELLKPIAKRPNSLLFKNVHESINRNVHAVHDDKVKNLLKP